MNRIVGVKDFDRNKFQKNEFLSVSTPIPDLGVGVMIVWMLDLLDELDQLRPIQNFRPNQVPTLSGLLLQRNSFFWNLFLSKSLAPTIEWVSSEKILLDSTCINQSRIFIK